MDYLLHIVVIVGIYSIVSVALNVLVGYAGMLSLAQAAYYGIGAYCSAVLAVRYGCGFCVGALMGMLVAATVSVVVMYSVLRVRGDYVVLATLGVQMLAFNIFNSLGGVTRGPLGIPGIPKPVIVAWHVESHVEYCVFVLLWASLTVLCVNRLSLSPFGRVLRAIREDEAFASALGKNTGVFKIAASAVSATLAALGGSLFAHYVSYIDPTSFSVLESIVMISMVIVGGAGSRWGPVVGAVTLVLLPEVFRFVGFPASVSANLRQILYGTVLVVILMLRPKGIVGNYDFSR